jgi:CheY-like chemotaxis protein
MPATTPNPSQESKREQITKFLRAVDDAVKKRNFDQALENVHSVFAIDPRNSYAHAFQERIEALKEEEAQEREYKRLAEADAKRMKDVPKPKKEAGQQQTEEMRQKSAEFEELQREQGAKQERKESVERELEAKARQVSVMERKELLKPNVKSVGEEVEKKIDNLEQKLSKQVHQVIADERSRFQQEWEQRMSELVSSVERQDKTTDVNIRASSLDEMRGAYESQIALMKNQLVQEMHQKLSAQRKRIEDDAFARLEEISRMLQNEILFRAEEEREEAIRVEQRKSKDRSSKVFESQMLLMLQLKIPSQVQDSLLRSLKIALQITDAEYIDIVRTVRVNKFVESVKEAYKNGRPTDEELSLLNKLQVLYNISEEEKLIITKRVKRELGLPDEAAPILVVDDEEYILEFVCHILKQTYKTVHKATSVELAEPILAQHPPALVISDVRMPAPGVGGFTFYERLKEGHYGENLKGIKFILMSALADEFFIKTAKQLGIQAYLVKPFTKEMLDETVKSALSA